MRRQLFPIVSCGVILFVLLGCGGDDTNGSTSTGEGGGGGGGGIAGECAPPSRLVEGTCREPGISDEGCAAGTLAQSDGSCLPAGVPPDGCGVGFSHDGDGGCTPILPAAPCPAGSMAVPGETMCRPIMDCGSGKWGNIPTDANTIFVDASYTGGGSVGSMAAPYTTVNQAIASAAASEVVAIAEGTYSEDVLIDRAVVLHGVCPSKVTLSGPVNAYAAVSVLAGATVRGVRITDQGAGNGVAVHGVPVTIDRCWIADNGDAGIYGDIASGQSADITLTGSLVEGNAELGMLLLGAKATITDSVIRDTVEASANQNGTGLSAEPFMDVASEATVKGSLVDGNVLFGINALGSQVVVQDSVIRGTQPNTAGFGGRGINAQFSSDLKRPNVTVRGSVIVSNHNTGIFGASADITLERTVVRDTRPEPGTLQSRNISIQASTAAINSPACGMTLRQSLVDEGHGLGIYVAGSSLVLESSIVRNTAGFDADSGRALNVRVDLGSGEASDVDMRGSVLKANQNVAFFIVGSSAHVSGSSISDTTAPPSGSRGRAMSIQSKTELGLTSDVVIDGSVFEKSSNHGIYVRGSLLHMSSSVVRDTVADLAGLGGRGLGVQPDPDLGVSGEATVFDSLFERNAGAGVYVLGSVLDMQRSAVAGTLSAELTGEGRGVSIQYDDVTGFASQANLSKVQVNGSREFGMFVQGSTVTLSDSTISATRSVDGLYGDGLALPSAGVSNQVIVSGSRIGDNERGGILLFDGSNLSLGSSELSCNAIDLVDGSSSAATQFDNQGGNACGCPAEPSSCKWVGTNVAAPLPLAPDDGSPDG